MGLEDKFQTFTAPEALDFRNHFFPELGEEVPLIEWIWPAERTETVDGKLIFLSALRISENFAPLILNGINS